MIVENNTAYKNAKKDKEVKDGGPLLVRPHHDQQVCLLPAVFGGEEEPNFSVAYSE